jgi:acyl carrier protein
MMTRDDVQSTVRHYIAELGDESGFTNDENLLETGVLHSIHVVELILFVSQTFSVELSPTDVYEGKLASVDEIVELVTSRAAA